MDPELLTKNYDYELPQELIASTPIYPRDNAKLLIYNRKTNTITHSIFKNLLDYIPNDCDIYLNDTRVIKARIFGYKEKVNNQGGGKVELFFNKSLDAFNFLVLIRGKVEIGTKLLFNDNLFATVEQLNNDGSRVVKFYKNGSPVRFEELILILDQIGHLPLPPYMQREDNKDDEKDYQTLFAKNAGAVAAPTASLHFTDELFEKLKNKFNTYTVTLHVGAGTFKPVESDEILNHDIHSEQFNIPLETQKAINNHNKVLAIGTTVTRTLEFFARTSKTQGDCDLFLNPANKPQVVDYLLTNFHLPKSTLIMLVSSFIGREKTLELYKEAIDNNYRFFSYGDAMLIL